MLVYITVIPRHRASRLTEYGTACAGVKQPKTPPYL